MRRIKLRSLIPEHVARSASGGCPSRWSERRGPPLADRPLRSRSNPAVCSPLATLIRVSALPERSRPALEADVPASQVEQNPKPVLDFIQSCGGHHSPALSESLFRYGANRFAHDETFDLHAPFRGSNRDVPRDVFVFAGDRHQNHQVGRTLVESIRRDNQRWSPSLLLSATSRVEFHQPYFTA